jgi:hypothetical protein
VKELIGKRVSVQRIAARLSRTSNSIRNLARQLGLKVESTAELRKSFGLSSRWSPYAESQASKDDPPKWA